MAGKPLVYPDPDEDYLVAGSTTMMSHAEARKVVEASFAAMFPDVEVGLGSKQLVQATGFKEGYYGAAFGGANNWGAVQPAAITAKDPPGKTCPPGTTPGTDSTPRGGKYTACLTVYATPQDGCMDMMRWMTKTKEEAFALFDGDNDALALAMYRAHYYGGFHPNAKEQAAGMTQAAADRANVQDRVLWIHNAVLTIAKALNEPVAIDVPKADPTRPDHTKAGFGALAVGASALTAFYWYSKGKAAARPSTRFTLC